MIAAPPIERTAPPAVRLLLGAAGVSACLATWEVLGRGRYLGLSWPALSAVVQTSFRSWKLLWSALQATFPEIVLGLVIGVSAAVLLALLPVFFPASRRGTHRLAVLLHATPLIVLAPVLVTVLGAARVPVLVAAFSSFFSMFVSTSSGFDAPSQGHVDLLRTLGASKWTSFWRLRLPSALPDFANGLNLAAPGAVLGAVFGQWFGAEHGLGVLLITAMQNLQVSLLWASALLTTLLSVIAIGLASLLQAATRERFR